ncbi:MAG: UDP-N-acetylglucosamine 2-epimerase [Muribaculaceae bacterium]|nr:UDP-N-acetylglucosamine 2-epimerase [Muribaculaceae bacterium]
MSEREKKLCFVSTTRADWGLLQPLAEAMRHVPGVHVQIVVANMHLMERYGMTVNEIIDAGFDVDARVHMDVDGDDEASRVRAMSLCLDGMADAFNRLHPDAVVLLGDRYEMLAVASAAAVMHIPIVHIAGGEISEGANDDSFRHAITKLASLHLTATEPYRRRVIQMGEQPEAVLNTGAIGVWNALNTAVLSADELSQFLGMELEGAPLALITYHPATNDHGASPAERVRSMLRALDAFPEMRSVITFPNNDAHSSGIIAELQAYAAAHPERVRLVQSLGMLRYQSLLRLASMVIGNSSSGIVEAPSAGVPTVDIGIRQRGRIAAPSVIHCEPDTDSIRQAIARALSPAMQELAGRRENPYFRPDTPGRMAEALTRFLDSLPAGPKRFYDTLQ